MEHESNLAIFFRSISLFFDSISKEVNSMSIQVVGLFIRNLIGNARNEEYRQTCQLIRFMCTKKRNGGIG